MPTHRADYLDNSHVQGFIKYLSRVINGANPINFTVGFSRNQLPEDFEQEFRGEVDMRDGGGAVYVVRAVALEDVFRMYWWNRQGYSANKLRLDAVKSTIDVAIEGENGEFGYELAERACEQVMEWGFGRGRRPYKANMRWAMRQNGSLVSVLRTGRASLAGENPNIEVFATGADENSYSPKMNAGWTKYYALALPNFVIYDGRVGAALGFLVRRYLESLDANESTSVPERLAFLWGDGDGASKLRDPSRGAYKFGKLYGGRYGSKPWARVNVWANWILCEARDKADATWCSGPDGLRKLEAALFMLGYDLSRADTAATIHQTHGVPRDVAIKAAGSIGQQTEPGQRAATFKAEIAKLANTSHAVGARKQLPKVTDANFRAALKEARLAAGLTYSELARRASIHAVMPSRYENVEHSNATLPNLRTWKKLNEVLFSFEPGVS